MIPDHRAHGLLLMSGRVFQNLFEDIGNWRNDRPLIKQAVIGGDV